VKFGGDSMEELRKNYNSYIIDLNKRILENFSN
jgi:hypothetical protein